MGSYLRSEGAIARTISKPNACASPRPESWPEASRPNGEAILTPIAWRSLISSPRAPAIWVLGFVSRPVTLVSSNRLVALLDTSTSSPTTHLDTGSEFAVSVRFRDVRGMSVIDVSGLAGVSWTFTCVAAPAKHNAIPTAKCGTGACAASAREAFLIRSHGCLRHI